MPCYPNPFNPITTIRYAIPENTNVTVKVYNILGQEIKTLVNAVQNQGVYTIQWDGTNQSGMKMSSGVYFYTLESKSAKLVRKMTLLK